MVAAASGSAATNSTSSPSVLTTRPALVAIDVGGHRLEPLDELGQLRLGEVAGQPGVADDVGEADHERRC